MNSNNNASSRHCVTIRVILKSDYDMEMSGDITGKSIDEVMSAIRSTMTPYINKEIAKLTTNRNMKCYSCDDFLADLDGGGMCKVNGLFRKAEEMCNIGERKDDAEGGASC